MSLPVNPAAEWLETDGLGGFASGTVSTCRTRRYHAWLLAATTPPTGRMVLVNGGDVRVETQHETVYLSAQHYAPEVFTPEQPPQITAFTTELWPTWTFRFPSGLTIQQELLSVHGRPLTLLRWTLLDSAGQSLVRLAIRPLFSGRDYHALHRENPDFNFTPQVDGQCLAWYPYAGVPPICALSNGVYEHEPVWYRNFVYAEEQRRGLDFLEDLAAPGTFCWDLQSGPALLLLSTDHFCDHGTATLDPQELSDRYEGEERARRGRFASPLLRAAESYVVRRDQGRTLVAGYPWFTDWGRDTFIALRGLCLSTRRFDIAEDILTSWSGHVSEGMLPNRFPDAGQQPEYNSVDASLWYVNAVAEFLQRAPQVQHAVSADVRAQLTAAVDRILQGYAWGTRFNIRMDFDGLIAAGEPGVQLTWMDAKVADWVVTPRIGKPVEIQALWLNALHAFRDLSPDYESWFRQGREFFQRRFWNPAKQCLFDVVDDGHEADRMDDSIRANQIFAVGGLPLVILPRQAALAVVRCVERELLTPWGLRTLSPSDPAYHGHYAGGVMERDAAYHQGTVWPWLLGAFVEAWLRVQTDSPSLREAAQKRFLFPMQEHLHSAGWGHLPEVADGDPPHSPGGCPFQAWSLGEFLRLKWDVLADS